MREAMIAIHSATGLEAISSPWLAVLPVFLALGLWMYGCAHMLSYAHKVFYTRPALRSALAIGALLLLMTGLFAAIGVASVIRYGAGVNNYDPFTIYHLALFLAANAPFWLVLWRRGVFGNARPNT